MKLTFCLQCLTGWVGPGWVCGLDDDNDGWSDVDLGCNEKSCHQDNCPRIPNSGQEDADSDGVGDACDNCRMSPNTGQEDIDGDEFGNACDNCPEVKNPCQEDNDGNHMGDACETVSLFFIHGNNFNH